MNIIKYYPYKSSLYMWNDLKVSSTTIFGAISNMWRLFYGEEDIGEFFKGYKNGEILFSSLFPFCVGKEKEILFYPRPILKGKYDESLDIPRENIKKLKKIRFLSERLFVKFMNSIEQEEDSYFYTLSFFDKDIVLDPPFALLKDEASDCEVRYDFIDFPHVSVDRFNITHEGERGYFHTQYLASGGGLGFYFLCNTSPLWIEKLSPLFRLLADEGIGGDRSIGKGLFEYVKIESYTPLPFKPKLYIGLSLVFPQKDERSNICSLSLEKDDGFLYYGGPISLKKSPVYFIKEGAVYKDRVKGLLLKESLNDIEIYRNGMAFLAGGEK